MGFGSFLKKAVGVAGTVASAATGNPLFAVGGSLLGGAGNVASALQGYPSSAGTAADPNTYVGIRLPGIKYPEGTQLVDYPDYPTLPQYGYNYGLPENIPLMPVEFMGATEGEALGMGAANDAASAYRTLLNPADPRILALAKDEQQLLRNDFLRGLKDLTNADRRQRALGRNGMLSGERGAETISRILTQNAQDTGLRARMNARQMLQDYGTNMRSQAATYQNQAQLETARRNAFRDDLARMVTQVRDDVRTRTNQKRDDYNARLDDRRADTLGRYDADVKKILSALRIGNQNMSNLADARTTYNANKQAYDSQRYNQVGSGIENILSSLSGLFGGGTRPVSELGLGPQMNFG